MIYVHGVAFRDDRVGRDLSPFLWSRLRLFMADDRVAGRVWVVSGSRSFASQLWLWTKWRAGVSGFNLAANPYRTIGTCYWASPPFVAKGSWHMVQESDNPLYAGAGAVDLGWSVPTTLMQSVAGEYGLRFPVSGEDWHAQAYNTAGIFPGDTTTIDPPTQGAPIVSTFGNASFEPVYADGDYLVLWHPIDGDVRHNFHLLNRATNASDKHAVGNAGDVFVDAVRDGSRFYLTIRRGGNGYHTVQVEAP